MSLKKLLIYGGIAVLLFYMISAPQDAAALVHNILGTLRRAAEALITFAKNVI